jgi:hypothetical protein
MPLSINLEDQDALKAFLARRHPDFDRLICHWDFLEETYSGGRDWFAKHLFKYIKEGDEEFKNRKQRAYRFNHTREIVDLIQKYIFKSAIARNDDDAPEEIKTFWKNVTRNGLDIDQFARVLCNETSKFGRVWVFVDTNKTMNIQTKADEKEAGAGVYAYIVGPQDILDVGIAEDGSINWVLVRETARDDEDPIRSSGEVYNRFRLWMKDAWYLFKFEKKSDNKAPAGIVTANLASVIDTKYDDVEVVLVDANVNPIGEVPGFPVDHIIGDYLYSSPALINDIAYLDRAIANYLSNLDAIIQDQTFSQLAMPAQGSLPGEEKYNQLIEMGTKRIFTYDGEGGAKPEFISPDPKQAGVIIEVINKIINEIYHSVGMAGERTKQDNSVGIDNSSGVAKAYDFDRLNSLLTMKSQALENAENKLTALVCKWYSIAAPTEELTQYADTFDVRSLYDEFTVAERLQLVVAPDMIRQEQMKQVITKLFPAIKIALREKMLADLSNWTPVEDAKQEKADALAAKVSAKDATSGNSAKKNPSTQSRQGQVTSKTGK